MKYSFRSALQKRNVTASWVLPVVTVSWFFLSIPFTVSAGLNGSPHDLSTKQCNVCHANHADAGQTPKWENHHPSTQFAIYYSPEGNGDKDSATESPSAFCLGCHNGVFGEFIEKRGESPTSDMEYYEEYPGSYLNSRSNPWDNHPVGFIYNPKNDADNNNFPPSVSMPGNQGGKGILGKKTGTYYPLYGIAQNRFECTTCHIAHEPVNDPATTVSQVRGHLLRTETRGSFVCRDCHRNKY